MLAVERGVPAGPVVKSMFLKLCSGLPFISALLPCALTAFNSSLHPISTCLLMSLLQVAAGEAAQKQRCCNKHAVPKSVNSAGELSYCLPLTSQNTKAKHTKL